MQSIKEQRNAKLGEISFSYFSILEILFLLNIGDILQRNN